MALQAALQLEAAESAAGVDDDEEEGNEGGGKSGGANSARTKKNRRRRAKAPEAKKPKDSVEPLDRRTYRLLISPHLTELVGVAMHRFGKFPLGGNAVDKNERTCHFSGEK